MRQVQMLVIACLIAYLLKSVFERNVLFCTYLLFLSLNVNENGFAGVNWRTVSHRCSSAILPTGSASQRNNCGVQIAQHSLRFVCS